MYFQQQQFSVPHCLPEGGGSGGGGDGDETLYQETV